MLGAWAEVGSVAITPVKINFSLLGTGWQPHIAPGGGRVGLTGAALVVLSQSHDLKRESGQW